MHDDGNLMKALEMAALACGENAVMAIVVGMDGEQP